MKRRVVLVGLAVAMLAGASDVFAQATAPGSVSNEAEPRWAARAEREFRLSRGLAPKVMTEEEWKDHQAQLQSMTGDDRERYRQAVRQKMLERAKEKGLTMPAGPRHQERQVPPS